jgi:hypothetical protein
MPTWVLGPTTVSDRNPTTPILRMQAILNIFFTFFLHHEMLASRLIALEIKIAAWLDLVNSVTQI